MKKQWPFWLFLIVIVIVIIVSLNYPKKSQSVHLGEIFEEGSSRKTDYVYKPDGDIPVGMVPEEIVPAANAVKTVAVPIEQPSVKPAVQEPVVVNPLPVTGATGDTYIIQILASKDKPSTEKALERARSKAGFEAAYIQTVDLGQKGTWYRIYVGASKTKTEAEELLGKVKVSYKDAFIRSSK